MKTQAEALCIDEPKRQAKEGIGLGHTNLSQQAQGLAVGTNADVLAVVESGLRRCDIARPPAGDRRHLEQRDLGVVCRALQGAGETGPTRADDRDRLGH